MISHLMDTFNLTLFRSEHWSGGDTAVRGGRETGAKLRVAAAGGGRRPWDDEDPEESQQHHPAHQVTGSFSDSPL